MILLLTKCAFVVDEANQGLKLDIKNKEHQTKARINGYIVQTIYRYKYRYSDEPKEMIQDEFVEDFGGQTQEILDLATKEAKALLWRTLLLKGIPVKSYTSVGYLRRVIEYLQTKELQQWTEENTKDTMIAEQIAEKYDNIFEIDNKTNTKTIHQL